MESLNTGEEAELVSDENTLVYGLDEIEETIRSNPDFLKNPVAQHVQFMEIHRHWSQENPKLTPDQKRAIVQRFSTKFSRPLESEKPQDVFRSIMELPIDDINRALRVRDNSYQNYKVESGEKVYLRAQGWLADYLDHAKYNEIPLAFHFWIGAAVLGAACRRNYSIPISVRGTQLNQYTILTGDKGTGKGEAMKIGLRVLERMNRQIRTKCEEGEFGKSEGIVVPVYPQDITQESLVSSLSDLSQRKNLTKYPNGKSGMQLGEACALIAADEFANFAGNEVYNAQKRITFLLTAGFEDNYYKATKGGGEERIDRMCLSLISTTQPGWMRNTITSDAMEGGFVERVNFIHREETNRSYSTFRVPIIDPLRSEALASRLIPLATAYGTFIQTELTLTAQAEEHHHEYYITELMRRRGGLSGEMEKQSIHRRCIHIMRMASILAISEQESLPMIEMKHVELATDIIEANDKHFQTFLAQAEEGTVGEKCRLTVDWLKSKGGRASRTEFSQVPRFKSWGAKFRGQILVELADTGQISLKRDTNTNTTWLTLYGHN